VIHSEKTPISLQGKRSARRNHILIIAHKIDFQKYKAARNILWRLGGHGISQPLVPLLCVTGFPLFCSEQRRIKINVLPKYCQ
jgi:hypothetical protein